MAIGRLSDYYDPNHHLGGFLAEEVVEPVEEWWDELSRLGHDVKNMSRSERAMAAIDAGIKTSTDFFNTAGSGLAGLGVLATGGSLDDAVTTIGRGVEESPIQYETRTPQGQTLLDLGGQVEQPLEEFAQAAGTATMRLSDNPEAAAGVETALGMFVGGKSAKANLRELDQAKLMIGDGADPKMVRQQLGWFQSPTGDWMFEVDDSTARLNPPVKADRKAPGVVEHKPETLGALLEHPELYEHYPELENYALTTGESRDYEGSFYPEEKEFFVRNKEPDAMKGTALHETQHAIQQIEGFDQGSNPSIAKYTVQQNLFEQRRPHTADKDKHDRTRKEYRTMSVADDLANLKDMALGNKGITPRRLTGRQDWYVYGNDIRAKLGPMPKRSGPKQKEWLRDAAQEMYNYAEHDHLEEQSEGDGYLKFRETQRLETNLNEMSSRERKNALRRLERSLDKTRAGSVEYDKVMARIRELNSETDLQTYNKALGEGVARLTQDSRDLTPQQRWEREPMDSMTVRDQWGEPITKDRNYFYPSKKAGALADRDVGPMASIDEFEAGRNVTNTPETLLSTRYPTAVGRTEDPHGNEILLSGIDSMDPKTLNKSLSAVTQYPGLKGRLRINSKPDRVMGEFLDLTRSNMQRVFEEMPDKMRDAAKQWYDGANKIRTGLANHYDISPEASSGVIAALSPQNPWDNNLAAAERVIDTYINEQETTYTPEMEAQYNKRVKMNKEGKSAWDKKDKLIDKIRGKRLGDLNSPRERAAWIRLFDEAHNSREYYTWSPEGKRVKIAENDSGSTANMSWGSFDEIESAVSVLDDPSLDNISKNMGLQHKVRNFYNNIENPNSMLPFYTSDTHNVSAALLRPLGGSSPEVAQSFGGKGSGTSAITGHRGTYPLYQQAGEDVARANKLMPRETQSIVWEAIRNIFTNKSEALKKEANHIWADYARGRLTMEQAQDRIIEASGGFKTPDWAK